MLGLMAIFTVLSVTAERYRDLPVGRALHAALIEGPSAWLTPARLRRLAIMSMLIAGLVLAFAEIGPVLATIDYAPVMMIADLTLYLDAVLLAVVAVAAVRIRSVAPLLRDAVRRVGRIRLGRARSSSPRRAKRPPPANDDAPGLALRMAA
jgi:hypothetical protein